MKKEILKTKICRIKIAKGSIFPPKGFSFLFLFFSELPFFFLFQIHCISYILYFFKQRTFYFWSRFFVQYLYHSTIPCLTAFQLGDLGECVTFLKCQRVELPLIMCKMCRNVHGASVMSVCYCINFTIISDCFVSDVALYLPETLVLVKISWYCLYDILLKQCNNLPSKTRQKSFITKCADLTFTLVFRWCGF